jgi:hypothetical protein
MAKTNLTRASQELFRRTPDETFPDLAALEAHCRDRKARGTDRWQLPGSVRPVVTDGGLKLALGTDGAFEMNDWSFANLCRLAGVAKDTVNRFSPETAARAFAETLPTKGKPVQALTDGETVRSLHGTTYTRLWDAELLAAVREFAVDFSPPPPGCTGGTGLYAGDRDLFCFLIDPAGWVEIDGEAFAPGFFVWNSEVGCRTLGVQTFWFQQICQNHIVWDAVNVAEATWKHTAQVGDALNQIRRMLDALVRRRDERRDAFAAVVKKAMTESAGADADEALKLLAGENVPQVLGKKAVELVRGRGQRFTIFALVDALTSLTREIPYAGERATADAKASRLLRLAAPEPAVTASGSGTTPGGWAATEPEAPGLAA